MTDMELSDTLRMLSEIEATLGNAVAGSGEYFQATERLRTLWIKIQVPDYNRRVKQLEEAEFLDGEEAGQERLTRLLQAVDNYVRDIYKQEPDPAISDSGVHHTTLPQARSLYLQALRVTNLKILADQAFSFLNEDGSPRLWTVFVGDNGLCKTTLLQAIALAASGDKLARALVDDADDYRHINNSGEQTSIEADFVIMGPPSETGVQGEFEEGAHPAANKKVGMVVEPSRHDFSGEGDADFFDDVRGRRVPGYLVVAFGVGRFLPRPGEVAISDDPLQDRIEGLFNARHKMLGNDFFDALEKKGGRRLSLKYADTLRSIFLATDEAGESLLPWLSNLELRGKDGLDHIDKLLRSRRFLIDVGGEVLKLRPTSLSHGYQSMIAWICELVGHGFLNFGDAGDPKELTGIVLLDEIDLHLHPTWQRRIVPILKQVFPQLQFIVSTHSPLVLTGFESEEIIELGLEGGQVVQKESRVEPGILTASELLNSYFMVERAGRPDLVRKEKDYLELKARTKRSSEEDQRMQRIEEEMRRYWSSLPDDLEAPDEVDSLHEEPPEGMPSTDEEQ